jgi:hypothetical protein
MGTATPPGRGTLWMTADNRSSRQQFGAGIGEEQLGVAAVDTRRFERLADGCLTPNHYRVAGIATLRPSRWPVMREQPFRILGVGGSNPSERAST